MIIFGTLLWIDEDNHSTVNNKNKNITSYFRQVDLLSKTLRSVFKSELVVFTNNEKRVHEWFSDTGRILPRIEKVEASISVPSQIRFYSAHFKVDALLAGLNMLDSEDDRFILLDSDVVANERFNQSQITRIINSDLIVYDISEQVFPAYGAEKIKNDLELITGEVFVDPKWFGGEFLGGNKVGLTRLLELVRQILPKYFLSINELHHIGDEMFVTAVINKLLNEGDLRIVNQAPYQMIARHWSRFTNTSLQHQMSHSFVHCPGSKQALEFLSLFRNPKKPYTYLTLRIYQFIVLFYQWSKSLVKLQG
jgi:hypothetical protein